MGLLGIDVRKTCRVYFIGHPPALLVPGWFEINSTALHVSRHKYILTKTFRLPMATH